MRIWRQFIEIWIKIWVELYNLGCREYSGILDNNFQIILESGNHIIILPVIFNRHNFIGVHINRLSLIIIILNIKRQKFILMLVSCKKEVLCFWFFVVELDEGQTHSFIHKIVNFIEVSTIKWLCLIKIWLFIIMHIFV